MNDPRDITPKPASPAELPGLAAGLMRLQATRASVPAVRDRAMRDAILAHFDRTASQPLSRRRSAPWIWAAGSAAGLAAVVALAAWLGVFARPAGNSPPSAPIATGQAADVDANGRIDILDAFALARKLESDHQPVAKALDLNGDGAIDQRDVDAIAMQAVALDPQTARPVQGGRSS